MALQTNGFEGQTSGTSATTSNTATSGFSLAFNRGTGSTTVYDNAHPAHGSIGLRLSSGASAACSGSASFTANTSIASRMPLYFTALPSATVGILGHGSSTPQVYLRADGKFEVHDAAGTTVFTSTAVLSTATQYRLELQCTAGGTTTTGTIQCAVYAGDSTTALTGGSYSSSTVNAGTAAYTQVIFGRFAGTAGAWDLWVDDLAYNDGATSFIGPPAQNPTAAFSTTSTAGLRASFDGTASSAVSPATISSFAWTFGDGGTATTSTPSHTYAAAGTYTVTLAVTDSNSLTNSVSHSVTVNAPAANVTATSVTASGWTASSGTLQSALSDASTSTYITSPTNPSSSQVTVVYAAMTPPTSGQSLQVLLRAGRLNSTSGTITAQLYEGATLRSTVSNVAVPDATGGVPGSSMLFSFPWSDISVITDWSAPKVVFSATAV